VERRSPAMGAWAYADGRARVARGPASDRPWTVGRPVVAPGAGAERREGHAGRVRRGANLGANGRRTAGGGERRRGLAGDASARTGVGRTRPSAAGPRRRCSRRPPAVCAWGAAGVSWAAAARPAVPGATGARGDGAWQGSQPDGRWARAPALGRGRRPGPHERSFGALSVARSPSSAAHWSVARCPWCSRAPARGWQDWSSCGLRGWRVSSERRGRADSPPVGVPRLRPPRACFAVPAPPDDLADCRVGDDPGPTTPNAPPTASLAAPLGPLHRQHRVHCVVGSRRGRLAAPPGSKPSATRGPGPLLPTAV
jgi:hypothetical protein